jgi:antitoxin component YwqK of YwqJK toxin-antitoxin module
LGDENIISISTGEAASPLAPQYTNYQNADFSSLVIDPANIHIDCHKRHKMSLTFYSNGRPSLLLKWRRSRLEEAVGWNADGSMNTTSILEGKGFMIQPHPSDGRRSAVSESHWLNGKRHGHFVEWLKQSEEDRCYDSSKHIKAQEGQYTNGKKDGIWLNWHGNGQICTEQNYINGKMNGEYKYWKYDGILQSIEHYKNDKRHGLSLRFFDNGKKENEAYYKNGVLIGRIAKWDELGNSVD